MALNFPDSPVAGQVYVNHESGFAYEWDGVVWNSITQASTSRIKIVDDISSSFNGILTSFPITSNSAIVTPKNNQSIIVNLGGVIQDPTDDYSISGNTLEFAVAPIDGLSFSAIILGSAYDTIITTSATSAYSEVAGISTTSQYASVAGISTTSQYASVAGISTTSQYASVSGISTTSTTSGYASVAGISTVSENLTGTPDIVVGAVTAGSVNSSGIVTALSFSGTVPSSSLSGPLPAIDGSQLTGVASNTSFLVSGRSSNTTILLSSGSFSIGGRAGDITINA